MFCGGAASYISVVEVGSKINKAIATTPEAKLLINSNVI